MSKKRPQQKDRKYCDLKGRQKGRIAEMSYDRCLCFYLEKKRMPDEAEADEICLKLFQVVKSLAPMASYDEFAVLFNKRLNGYEERILRDIENGIRLESLKEKRNKKPCEPQLPRQDDTLYYIAGYTPCSFAYGISREEMGKIESEDSVSLGEPVFDTDDLPF